MKREIKQKKCLQCSYTWTSKANNPKQCPRCKRYDWNTQNMKGGIKK